MLDADPHHFRRKKLTYVCILFLVRNPSYDRHYESLLPAVGNPGHDVYLAVENLGTHARADLARAQDVS